MALLYHKLRLFGGQGDTHDGTLGILYEEGKGFNAVEAGLGKRCMLLHPWRSAHLAGGRPYSYLKACE